MALFEQDGRERRGRRWACLAGSAVAHAMVIALLVWPAVRGAAVLAPRYVAHGEGGNAVAASSIALYVPNDLKVVTAERPSTITAPPAREQKPHASPVKKRSNALEVKNPSGELEAGSPNGSSYFGDPFGDEVKPALPAVFPDLKISRSELPPGVQGEVIVEVTIDARGAVIEEKLLQGLGHGIDERVIALLHDWRYTPATRNGVPIPSKHDVHFRFPS